MKTTSLPGFAAARIFQTLAAIYLLCHISSRAGADQLRFDTVRDWQQWQLPLGIVELTRVGVIEPVQVRKDINAALNAARFGGGIRSAGSNPQDAILAIDGDRTTGWSPNPDDAPGDWFIEIDLGRGVSAYRVHLFFDETRPPFELFDLLLSTGEPETDNIAAPVEGTLVYRMKKRFKENKSHKVTFEFDQPDYTPIQYLRIESLLHMPGARLVEVEVEAIGDNLALSLLAKGGNIEIIQDIAKLNHQTDLGNALTLVDGDLFKRWRNHRVLRGSEDIWSHITIDLGAVYWVDQVRIIGGVVVRSGFGGGIYSTHYVSRRRWDFRVYELLTSDGSLSPDGTRIWTKYFSGTQPGHVTSRGMVDHSFTPLPTRFIRIPWLSWDVNCGQDLGESSGGCGATATTEEIQIFGSGFPQVVQFRSPLLDLGAGKNLNSIEWDGDIPPGTRIEIRSRTGDEVVENYAFHDKNGKEVTEKKWNKLIPSFRGPIDTTFVAGGDWSPWSNIYNQSGQEFQSPSPRRYLKLDVRLVANDRWTAPSLDYLAVNFSLPLAQTAVGEIYPLEARPGTPIEFSYYLRPLQTRSDGFDQLSVEASAPLHFMDAFLDDQTVAVVAETTAAGFRVTFPRPVRSDELIELRFQSSVFLQSTRFDLFLGDSRQSIRQRVDPGDATDKIESSTNVVHLPVARTLFANLEITSPVFTPNGDGLNDELLISIDLVNVLAPRPLRFRIFDLSGQTLWEAESKEVAGQQHLTWDGRTKGDRQVPPGLYLLELHLTGDAREEKIHRLVTVVY